MKGCEMMSAKIKEMRERLELANSVERDLGGAERRGLDLTDIGDYVIVDDGHDRWIALRDQFDEALEDVIESVLDGSMTPDPDENHRWAYDSLWRKCGCLYSRIGSPSDIYDLVAELECEDEMMLEIFDALALEDEDLPAMIRVVHDAGSKFSGNNVVDEACDWIDKDFDAESAEQWFDAGFWDAPTAAVCREGGLQPSDAEDAEARLIELHGAESFVDGPIYAACNADISAQRLIDAYDAMVART